MKKFHVVVPYTVYEIVEIEAENFEEAKNKVIKGYGLTINSPGEGEYVEQPTTFWVVEELQEKK